MNGAIRTTGRRAFTLIELLVVISIIGVLMGLILSGVQRFRVAGKRAQAVVEINQLSAACDTFKNEYGFYPPNSFSGATPADQALVKRMYPHGTGAGFTPPAPANNPLQGGQCMVYFLGGPNGTGWDYGGPTAPSAAAASKKIYFDFPTARVTNYRFVDPWGSITETPLRSYYKYVGPDTTTGKFTATAVDGITPYQRSGKYENDGKCQIFSAGNNKVFASNGSGWTLMRLGT